MKNNIKVLIILLISIFWGLLLIFHFQKTVSAATCGNGVCESGETCSNCSIDCGSCGPTCGNGICESGETCSNCSIDCGSCGPTCGNGVCESGETCSNCSIDCGSCGPTCGNGICESGEVNICCSDCPPTCGNGVCEPNCGESASNCCLDCYVEHYQKKCYDNDVYWYDCNGQRKNKYQECGTSGWTDEYRCAGNWVQRKYINRGCSNAQCYATEEWKDYQYCSNYCLNGKCVFPPTVITKGAVVTY